jgi:hypothetical protein
MAYCEMESAGGGRGGYDDGNLNYFTNPEVPRHGIYSSLSLLHCPCRPTTISPAHFFGGCSVEVGTGPLK